MLEPGIEGADDFQREVVFGMRFPSRLLDEVFGVVRAVSLETVREVKIRMPVDTGAARARWGSPGAPGGIWEEDRDALAVTQGAGLEPYEYIARLNAGSSSQAPAGFIDAAAEKANDKLSDGALEVAVKAWGDG